jgi:hypothetical protein
VKEEVCFLGIFVATNNPENWQRINFLELITELNLGFSIPVFYTEKMICIGTCEGILNNIHETYRYSNLFQGRIGLKKIRRSF